MRSACRRVKKAKPKARRGRGRRPEPAAYGRVSASQALGVLGPESFAEVLCVRVPGRVVWCNFDLARELGFDVPPSNLMTPEFHEEMLDAFSYRAVKPGEETAGAKTVRLYADKYGGDGVRPALGAARAGTQLRPAHLLVPTPRRDSLLGKFVRMTRATGQLVTRRDEAACGDVPDLRATMQRVIADHARTAAEHFRWRMIHGALNSSNMELSGAMLDLPTQSTQPRTAPAHALDFPDSVFGREHIERATRLAPVYRKMLRSIPSSESLRTYAPSRPSAGSKALSICAVA